MASQPPSKRQRGASSSTATPTRTYDRSKFRSAAAADRYDYMVTKALTPERGLAPEGNDGEMLQQIYQKGWLRFTAEPEPAVVNVVKEFYANAEDKAPFTAFVRGRTVPFSADAINAFYQLRVPHQCQYAYMRDFDPDYEEVIQTMTKPGTTWIKGRKGGTVFHSKDLSRYGKIWYAFLCAKLLPSTHTSDVTKEKALLLFAIVQDLLIDIGAIINFSIRRCLRGNFSGGLPHPSLICGLCHQAGVRWSDDEPTLMPLQLLDTRMIARYSVWPGGESHPWGLGFIFPSASEPEDDAEDTSGDEDEAMGDQGPEHTPQTETFSTAQFLAFQNQMTLTDRATRREMRRLALRQDHMFDAMNASFTALNTTLQNIHPAATFPYQQPRPLPRFPPSDSDEEEHPPPPQN